jgi:hypothetical protein
MSRKKSGVLRFSVLIILTITLSTFLLAASGCSSRTSSDIWIAIPDSQRTPETLKAAQVAAEVLSQVEPSAQVGLLVSLRDGQSFKMDPSAIGSTVSNMVGALGIIGAQPSAPAPGTSVLTGILPPSGKLILIAPASFATPSVDETSALSRNQIRLYLVSSNTSVSASLAGAMNGEVFSPQDPGGLVFAIARAISAALGPEGQVQTADGGGAYKFSVPHGGETLLALPETTSWHVLDNQGREDQGFSWDISGESLVLIKQEGTHVLLSSSPATVMAITGGQRVSSLSIGWIVGIATVVVAGLLFLAVLRWRPARKVEPHAILRIGSPMSAPALATVTCKGLVVGSGTPPVGKDFYELPVIGKGGDQPYAEWSLQGRDVILIPHASVNINGHPAVVPRKIHIGETVSIGETRITLIKISGK